MDKLKLTGQNLGRVFKSKSGCMCVVHLLCSEAIRPNLKLKTRPKQLLGYRAPRLCILADIFAWLIDLSLVE